MLLVPTPLTEITVISMMITLSAFLPTRKGPSLLEHYLRSEYPFWTEMPARGDKIENPCLCVFFDCIHKCLAQISFLLKPLSHITNVVMQQTDNTAFSLAKSSFFFQLYYCFVLKILAICIIRL